MSINFSFSDWIHEKFRLPYRLHAQANGKGDSTIILLHGLAASSKSWEKLLPLISTHYRCITIDLLGFGESPKPKNVSYSVSEHVTSIHHTIKKLGLNEPYILIGHSLGSLLAAHYTRKYSNEVKELYMLSPPIYVSGDKPSKMHIRLRSGAYAKAYAYFRSRREFTLAGAKQLKKILRGNFFNLTEETWIAFERTLEQCIEKQDILEDFKHINTPTKVFYGLQDPLIIPGNIQNLAKIDSIKVKRARVGHVVNERYAEIIAKDLRAI